VAKLEGVGHPIIKEDNAVRPDKAVKRRYERRHTMGRPKKTGVNTPKTIKMEIDGNAMVAIPIEEFDQIVQKLEDYEDIQRAKKILADKSDPVISFEEGRRKYLGNHIKRVRGRKKMTQKALAKKLGVSQGRVSEIEKADYRPTMKTYRRVAKALSCDVTELI
jgi:DNA-binding XRE family transcriptional regulator